MKTGWVVLGIFAAIIIIFVISALVYENSKNKKALAQAGLKSKSTDLEKASRDLFNKILISLQGNAMNNPLTFNVLKDTAKTNGLTVVRDTDTITQEYNPKRLVIKETARTCIQAPCYPDFQIVSIG